MVNGKDEVGCHDGGCGEPEAVHSAETMRFMAERTRVRVWGVTVRMLSLRRAEEAMMFSV